MPKKIIKREIGDLMYIKKISFKQIICLMDTFLDYNTLINLGSVHGTNTKIPHFIIKRDGKIIQNYDVDYYNHHFYSTQKEFLNKKSITVGFENYGYLNLNFESNGYQTFFGKDVDEKEVFYNKPFRGKKYFNIYTEKQYKSANYLLKILCKENNIKKNVFRSNGLINLEILKTFSGVCSASSLDYTRLDINPSFDFKQIELT